MKQIIGGTMVLLAGITMLIFKKKIVDYIMKTNNEGGLGFSNYGKPEKDFGFRTIPLFGLLLAAAGILILLGVWELK